MSACCWLWIFICFSFFGFNRSSLGIWSQIKWHAQLSDTIVDELRAWSFILPIITFFYLGIRSTINSFNILNWFIFSCRGFTLMSILFAFPFLFFPLERTTWSLGLWQSIWKESLYKYSLLLTQHYEVSFIVWLIPIFNPGLESTSDLAYSCLIVKPKLSFFSRG